MKEKEKKTKRNQTTEEKHFLISDSQKKETKKTKLVL